MKQLTEEDQGRVEDRLKDADTSIPMRIISLYRYLVKASRDGTKTYDLGIPTVGEKLSMTRRAKDYLKSQELMLERISPKVLVEKTFAKGDEKKSIAEVREAFLKFPELSILESEQTFNNAVIQGVNDGTSGLLIGDKLHYKETISMMDIIDDASIVTKEFAEKLKKKEGIIEKEEKKEKEEVVKIEKEIIKKVSLRAEIPWDKLSDFVRGVVIPLSTEGAQISLEIKVEAQSEKGISRNTLDSKVKETLNQIGAKILEEKEE